LLRNRRLIIKINLGDKEKESLDTKRNLMFNSNHEIIGEETKLENITKSPLDLLQLKQKLRADSKEEPEEQRYNLRIRREKTDKRQYNLRNRK
jgi:hypothetical protein